MNHFFLNIIHRPELVPEYIDCDSRTDKKEIASPAEVVSQSMDIFKYQQALAHENNLKTTIQMTFASLFNDEAIQTARQDHEKYGDEISLTFLGLNCKEFLERFKNKELAIWLYSMEDKKAIVDFMFEKFFEKFGFYPTSTGSYYMDAELVAYIKQKYPIKTAIATCFEEGPKVFHQCNHSWYTLLDGGPWDPWIPSKYNMHCIASGEEDDLGIVALPHLSRDLFACIDSPGDMYGTHPQNIMRAMIHEGMHNPYLLNLIDQYNHLRQFNKNYSYNLVYVGAGWMGKSGRWEATYPELQQGYIDMMKYYGKLKKQGQIQDKTMTEFADWFRANKKYTEPHCALWKDILYQTKTKVFWYADPFYRVLIEPKLGGAITDLRPYAAKLVRPVGAGTQLNQNASYPFIIQSRYRAGTFTHYAGEGAIKSCRVEYNNEVVDLIKCRTEPQYSEKDQKRILTLKPVTIDFSNASVAVETRYEFIENTGKIMIYRRLTAVSKPGLEVMVNDYLTSCYGTTEYPEDMTGSRLALLKNNKIIKKIDYQYQNRTEELDNFTSATAIIPAVQTKISLIAYSKDTTGYIKEGYSFAPNLSLGARKKLKLNEELITCLKVEKAE